MSSLNSNIHNYAVFAPQLSSARVVTVNHSPFNYKLQSLQVIFTGILVGAIFGMGGYLVQLRSSALTPVPESPAASQPVQAKIEQPAPTEPVATPVAAVAPVPQPESAPTTLQGVIDKWNKETKGTFGVSIIEMGGQGRTANLNASKQFNSASLYKLYLAHYLYDKADEGALSLSGTFGMTKTIDECIRLMIVNSDNYCGEAMGAAVGWTALHNYVRASGFSGTVLSPSNLTTANDMANFLSQLYSGTLISSGYSNQLLTYMHSQIYRSAIPAGVPGVSVADKVGFNPGIWNDAGIVYGPKSTYVMVVLSNAGPSAIKDLSTRVSNFLNK